MKNLMPLLVTSLILFSGYQSKATMMLGADIQWKCLGNDTYEIKMVVYRRCTDGANSLSASSPEITSDSCTNFHIINAAAYTSWTIEDITPVCNSSKPCVNPNGSGGASTLNIPVGIERHTFTYKIYLGGSFTNCCWYKIKYEQCCRYDKLTTGYDSRNFYTEAWLNRCASPCDNGPEFRSIPLALKAAGQDVLYQNDIYDPDGDSLSYRMVNPLISSGSGSLYTSPWSATYPITCLGGNNPDINANPPTGFNLDPANGNMLFRPMQVQASTLKVEVTEWRKISGTYKVIGRTNRDMQLNIASISNDKMPSLTGPFNYYICAGQQLCITINTGDQDFGDTSRIYWNHGIPNGIWSTNNGSVKHATAQLCWTPALGEESSVPYYFSAIVNDDHCPVMGTTYHSFEITVNRPAKPTIAQYHTTLICGTKGIYQWYLNNVAITGATDSIYNPSQTGSYTVKITINGCSNISDPFTFTVGINAGSLNSKIKISPNPFHDRLTVEITDNDKPLLISVYDITGKLVLHQQSVPKISNVNTGRLSNGIYLLEITDGENKVVYKVQKQ